MNAVPDILDLRCLWALYVEGDWQAVALLCTKWDVAFWDLGGATCNCS